MEPLCAGYWQDLKGLQYLPSLARWFGHMDMVFAISKEVSNNPTLARINWNSERPDFERWQVWRWTLVSSTQSPRPTKELAPLNSPHEMPPRPKSEQLLSILTSGRTTCLIWFFDIDCTILIFNVNYHFEIYNLSFKSKLQDFILKYIFLKNILHSHYFTFSYLKM